MAFCYHGNGCYTSYKLSLLWLMARLKTSVAAFMAHQLRPSHLGTGPESLSNVDVKTNLTKSMQNYRQIRHKIAVK